METRFMQGYLSYERFRPKRTAYWGRRSPEW